VREFVHLDVPESDAAAQIAREQLMEFALQHPRGPSPSALYCY
jgi:hypothetical protein